MRCSRGIRPGVVALAVLLALVAAPVRPTAARAAPILSRSSAMRATAPVTGVEPAPADIPSDAARAPERDTRHLLVRITRSLPVTSRPGAGRVIGTMPAGSRFYDQSIVAWVLEVSEDGRYGLVPAPYVQGDVTGWIALRGLERRRTPVELLADLSEHRIEVRRDGRVVLRARVATGAPGSPTPVGRYFVTDRVVFPSGGALGSFAFGISGIQTDLPAGWTGGDQLAIHGTDAPATIGTSASAGCLRVSERVLNRLRPLLRPGTPVVILP